MRRTEQIKQKIRWGTFSLVQQKLRFGLIQLIGSTRPKFDVWHNRRSQLNLARPKLEFGSSDEKFHFGLSLSLFKRWFNLPWVPEVFSLPYPSQTFGQGLYPSRERTSEDKVAPSTKMTKIAFNWFSSSISNYYSWRETCTYLWTMQ